MAALVLVGAALDVGGVAAARAQNAPPAPGSGWTTLFDDDFAGPAQAAPNLYNWTYDTGPGNYYGDGQVETMTDSPDNVSLDGHGHLVMTALGADGAWTSGRIQTARPDVSAPPGGELEVTASIEQPDPAVGAGYWPAFWLLGPGTWPENGEIDIMESVDALSQNGSAVHCGTGTGGPCDEPAGIGSGLLPCPDCQTGYHTYTVILDRTDPANESITFYLDGRAYFAVTEGQIGTAAWSAAFDHGLSVVLDLAVGGAYADSLCNCTSPTSSTTSGAAMRIAYVAAYQTSAAPPAPLTGYHGVCAASGDGTANYAPVQTGACTGDSDQEWTYDTAGGTLRLFGMCLDVDAGGTANRTPVDLFYCDGTGAQTWKPQPDGA
ncbi:MAG: ricin-type beta-trefoil lectin domain protein, partial [Trebonia sp.]